MRTMGVCFGLAALLCSPDVRACAPAPHAGEQVSIVEESALIVWEPGSKTQHFIRRATFSGKARDFGFLVPTPTPPVLAPVDDALFGRLAEKTARRFEHVTKKKIDWTPLLFLPFSLRRSEGVMIGAAPPVQVLSTQKVGGYEAAILDATDAAALGRWLAEHGYATTPDLSEWLDAYVRQRWIISAFKIDKSQPEGSARTEAVKMSFTTERPFFPYREPASQREGASKESRTLRIWFVGPERVAGTIGADRRWPAELKWSDALGEAEIAGVTLPANARLTAFEDAASPRPGTDDLFFARDADQQRFVPPPVVVTETDTANVPADLIVAPVLIGLWLIRRRRRRALK